MPLRARILLGWGLILAVLAAAFLAVVLVQREYTVGAVDDRLEDE